MDIRKLVSHTYAQCGTYMDAYLAHGYGWSKG